MQTTACSTKNAFFSFADEVGKTDGGEQGGRMDSKVEWPLTFFSTFARLWPFSREILLGEKGIFWKYLKLEGAQASAAYAGQDDKDEGDCVFNSIESLDLSTSVCWGEKFISFSRRSMSICPRREGEK